MSADLVNYIRLLEPADLEKVHRFLSSIPPDEKDLFSPHEFDYGTLFQLFIQEQEILGFLGFNSEDRLIAYFVLKKGLINHEFSRLKGYHYDWDSMKLYSFAPYLTPEYRNMGVGSRFLGLLISELRKMDVDYLVLWGGVRNENQRAVRFYKKNGFKRLGEFYHKGLNTDMILNLNRL